MAWYVHLCNIYIYIYIYIYIGMSHIYIYIYIYTDCCLREHVCILSVFAQVCVWRYMFDNSSLYANTFFTMIREMWQICLYWIKFEWKCFYNLCMFLYIFKEILFVLMRGNIQHLFLGTCLRCVECTYVFAQICISKDIFIVFVNIFCVSNFITKWEM